MTTKVLIKEFYTMLAMVGVKEAPGGIYPPSPSNVNGGKRKAHAQVCDVTVRVLGGKAQAMKLIRHCYMAQSECSISPEAFGVLDASFLRVVEAFPTLRSFYENAKLGAHPPAWSRLTRAGD